MIALVYLVCGLFAALLAGWMAAIADPSKRSGHWGGVKLQSAVDQATPYREAPVHTDAKPRSAPWLLRLLYGFIAVSGVFTVAFLAPAGMLLLLLCENHPIAGAVLIVSTSGFVAGTLMVSVARSAAQRKRPRTATMLYLYVHHAAVLLTMAAVETWTEAAVWLFSLCIGGALGLALMLLHLSATQMAKRPAVTIRTAPRRPRSQPQRDQTIRDERSRLL